MALIIAALFFVPALAIIIIRLHLHHYLQHNKCTERRAGYATVACCVLDDGSNGKNLQYSKLFFK